jgi:hypothetical protein
MIVFTPNLPCPCGEVLKQVNWNQLLGLNIFFLALSVIGIMLNRKREKLKPGMELPAVVFMASC